MSNTLIKKPIITIKEARKVLGIDYLKLSDEEIYEYINEFDKLANLTIEIVKFSQINDGV